MEKRGFTLVELLIVIVVLGVIMAIAVPSIGAVTQAVKDNMLEKKLTIIEEAAIMLGQDIKGSIISSQLKYNNYSCKSFLVSDLVPHYLDSDNSNACLTKDDEDGIGCITDPSDSNNYLDKEEIIIYYKNKRLYAVVDIDDNLFCSEGE